jgi:hypothetical protein
VADLSALGLGRLVRLLASDKPGEVVAAAHAIVRTLKKNSADIHALADHIEHANGKQILEEDMRRIFTAGYDKGVRDTEAKMHGDDDFHDIARLPTHYEMAMHCLKREDELSKDNEKQFIRTWCAELNGNDR